MCAVYCTCTCVRTFVILLTRICIHVSSVCTLHVLHMYCTTTCTHSLMVVGVVIHVHVLPGQLLCKNNDSPELTYMLYCGVDNVHCMHIVTLSQCTLQRLQTMYITCNAHCHNVHYKGCSLVCLRYAVAVLFTPDYHYSRKYWRELYLADCSKMKQNCNWWI